MASRETESMCLLVDISQGMGGDLESVKPLLLSIAQKKIIELKAKTKMGLVIMGSKDAVHDLELNGYDNVRSVPIEPTNVALMQAIRNLQNEEKNCPYMSGLIVAAGMLKDEGGGKAKLVKRLVVISNGKSDFEDEEVDGQPCASVLQAVAQGIRNEGLQLTVYGINFTDNVEARGKGEIMLRKLVLETCGDLQIISSRDAALRDSGAISRPQANYNYRGAFEFTPHIKIKVCTYPATTEAKMPSLKKRRKESDKGMVTEMRTVLVDDPDTELKPEDLTSAFKYGQTILPLSDVDTAEMKYETSKRMALLGVVKRAMIPQHYLMGTADIVVQDREDQQPSSNMLSAIAQALDRKNLVAVVSWVRTLRASGQPKIYWFFPYINRQDEIHGFHAVRAPFSDDIRPQLLRPLDKSSKKPTDEQLDAARRAVEGARLDNGSKLDILDPSALMNPATQTFYNTLVNKATTASSQTSGLVGPNRSKDLNPSSSVWEKDFVNELLSKCHELFPVDWIKPETADYTAMRAGPDAHEDGAGICESQEPALKRQHTATVRVKKEDEKFPLVIPFSRGLDDSAQGVYDPVAKFEKLFEDDSDEAIKYMKGEIENLVDKATSNRPLETAVEYLQKLRHRCMHGRNDEPEQYDRIWEELEAKYGNNRAVSFWQNVAAKGPELGRISAGASQAPTQPAITRTAPQDTEIDEDDFE